VWSVPSAESAAHRQPVTTHYFQPISSCWILLVLAWPPVALAARRQVLSSVFFRRNIFVAFVIPLNEKTAAFPPAETTVEPADTAADSGTFIL